MKQNKNQMQEQKIIQSLRKWSASSIETIFNDFSTSFEGLSSQEAAGKLEELGPNEIVYEKRNPWYMFLLRSFLDPFILILVAIVVISYFTDVALATVEEKSWMTIVIISIMIVISIILRFTQEYKSQITADKLKDLVPTTTAIKRNGEKPEEILMTEVVPGDIIYLAAGDLIPADMRFIETTDLFVSQSSLTGESEPVEKYSSTLSSEETHALTDLENIGLMGTTIISGSAYGVALQTGGQTYFGSIADALIRDKGETNFEQGVRSVSYLLIRFMLIMVPIVFLVNGITKKDWISALLFAISVAVGLTPEMLPTLVSTNLAKGALSLSKKKIIVKRLNSIQSFGAMDILCTDKTGTLTEDEIVLERYLDVQGNETEQVLQKGYLNSYYQTGLKNLMDVAVMDRGEKEGLGKLTERYTKIDEIPFDFLRRRMSVVVENQNNERLLITKGAVEEILSICSVVKMNGEYVPLTEDIIETVTEKAKELNQQGLRVLGVAEKTEVPGATKFGVKDESEMVLIGYMGFLDPPKESAVSAIKALHSHGVNVKILTGDNEIVTQKIAKDVGIQVNRVLLGTETERMDRETLYLALMETNIIAKLSPAQKERIIQVLQEQNHTVGFLGDGINDAPALKQADVGISVDTAVDIAQESADLIMLEKSLDVLEDGVVEGRRVFGNIIKYVKMTASSNFGNVFSVLVASAFLPFLPMLPIQLLTQDLLYGISQIAIPWDNMDEEYLEKPQQWNAGEIGKFMLYIGPISSIFDIVTFLVMWFVFQANTLDKAPLFQSGWFIVGLLTQTLIVHMIRTEKIPFIQSHASAPVIWMTVLIMGLGVVIPYTPFGTYLGFVPLPAVYFFWLTLIILGYSLLTEIIKRWYIRRFGHWM